MAKYICDQGHIFIHPAKETDHILSGAVSLPGTMHEIMVCPFCFSKSYDEFVEPEAAITSVKSVPLEEVDTWLKEGYVVRELYAKTATLVKLEAKAP